MNKIINFGAMLTIAAGAVVFNTSCSSNDFTPMSQAEIEQANYEAAFVSRFGQPASNQSWGFSDFSKGTAKAVTRWANTNANMWAGDGWDVPAVLTNAQKDIVRQYFQQNKKPESISINYTDFFVQDVYKGGSNTTDAQTTEKYKAANGSEFTGSDKMNKLTAGSSNDHINNYNNAQCSENTSVWDGTLYKADDPNAKNFHTDKIMLMQKSSTDCFGFSNTLQSGIQYNNNFVIVSGNTIMDWAKANGKSLDGDVTGMYFVGFDYDANFENGFNDKIQTNSYLVTEVAEGTEGAFQIPNTNDGKYYIDGAADGYYSDWIVRIKPGKDTTPEPTPLGAVRVIAEDLSVKDNSDFDFNDVVFDVKLHYPDNNTTTIILQAAGGTLPLKVADQEVHGLFGVETNVMVNTGAGATVDPVEFQIKEAYTDAIDIPVQVLKNGEWIDITATRAKAAAKIAVSTSFEWCGERQDIIEEHPRFADYVSDPTVKWY